MPARKDALSILVVDEAPEILNFFARLLDTNGMRALLARTPDEAIEIARREYIPIDLVVTDTVLKGDSARLWEETTGSEVVDRVRALRPNARALYMMAGADDEVIRLELAGTTWKAGDPGLVETIRAAATAPMVQRVGGAPIS